MKYLLLLIIIIAPDYSFAQTQIRWEFVYPVSVYKQNKVKKVEAYTKGVSLHKRFRKVFRKKKWDIYSVLEYKNGILHHEKSTIEEHNDGITYINEFTKNENKITWKHSELHTDKPNNWIYEYLIEQDSDTSFLITRLRSEEDSSNVINTYWFSRVKLSSGNYTYYKKQESEQSTHESQETYNSLHRVISTKSNFEYNRKSDPISSESTSQIKWKKDKGRETISSLHDENKIKSIRKDNGKVFKRRRKFHLFPSEKTFFDKKGLPKKQTIRIRTKSKWKTEYEYTLDTSTE